MRNFKKFLTLVLAVMMVVSTMSFTTSAATTKFEDVSADNEYLADAVDLLSYMGVAKGVSETKFGTDELVTRQQFSLFIYRMMKGGKDAPATGTNSTNFTDLVDPTYNFAISWAYQNGIVSGRTATTFDPTGAITLQEAYTMIVRALDYEADGEKLAYPFGYIEVAEKEEVNLPEGLDSSVDYTDSLTRGDMAVLLYNAFFAEIGVAEVEYKERTLSDNSVVLVEEETYPRLCEKAFDVKEVEYQAVGTPHFSSDITDAEGNNSTFENTLDLGYDAILFNRVDGDVNIKAPASAYIAAEDIGVEAAELDNYFLANFTMFVTLDEDNAIESVLFADSNMTKKTVDEIKLATVSTNKQTSYYNGTDAKLLSGKATADGEVIYFFNAPYSYVTPTYDTKLGEDEKYELKNAENIGRILITVDDLEDGTFIGTATEMIIPSLKANHDATGVYATEAVALAAALEEVYYGGLYEADLYDVDGDGIYDYMNYKPYSFFQVNTDEDFEFYADGVASTTTVDGTYSIDEVYTNEATLLGEKFEDEDYVIGYYNQAANTIKVAQVIKPVTATIKSYKSAEKTITLSDDTTVSVDGAWKTVRNFKPANVEYEVEDYVGFTAYDTLLNAANINDDEIDLYIYDGIVLYQTGAQSAALTFANNLIIPTADKNGDIVVSEFDTSIGEKLYYIHAWVDGDLKWVPVETEEIYPAIVTSATTIDAAYEDQLCTYSVGANGVYTITALAAAEDENQVYEGINKDASQLLNDEDEDIQYIETGINGVKLVKQVGTRFTLVDTNGANVLSNGTNDYRLNLNAATKIVIKNNKFTTDNDLTNDEVEFIEYDVDRFTTSSDVELNNVSIVVANDIDNVNREDLVVLYGEANDFDLKGAATSTGYRIIAGSDANVDENGYYRNYYTVYDPFTGDKATNVAGNKTSSNASGITNTAILAGSVVELKDGKVNDQAGTVLDTFNVTSTAGLAAIDNGDAQAGMVWILEYDEAEKVLITETVGGNWYDAGEGNSFQVDNNTVVTLIKYENATNFVKSGTMSLLTAADLGSNKNDYKCYNDKVSDGKGGYKTGHAKYIKAYVVTENEQNLEDGELNKVNFVIITVHGGEDTDYLTTNKRP